jgi:hypothetical protein|tara:strand:- start:455 stop:685 length:231 start_codon:yes stop_codon:yes gene_type:complete
MINENRLETSLKNKFGKKYFGQALAHTPQSYNSNSGHDSGSRAAGSTSSPSGIPHQSRHRQFLGMSSKKFSITLGH